jgi:hypothetical protein
MSMPPEELPFYRVLTGPDDATFCRRVSEAISLGHRLHGGPAITFDGKRVQVAQALLWPTDDLRDHRHRSARLKIFPVWRASVGPADEIVPRREAVVRLGVQVVLGKFSTDLPDLH